MRTAIYSPLNRRLSEIMKAARIEAGMTQLDLAKATGRTQAYISKFENGHLRLDVEDFIRFGAVTHLELDGVIGELTKFAVD